MSTQSSQVALWRCIEILGSQTTVAAVVDRSPQAVSEIVRRQARVPAEWCRPLETATAVKGQRVSASELRPDLFGPAPPDAAPAPAISTPNTHEVAA